MVDRPHLKETFLHYPRSLEQARWVKTVKALSLGSEAPLGSDRRLRIISWIAIDWVTCRSVQQHRTGLMYSQAMVSLRRMSRASHAQVIGNNEKLFPGSRGDADLGPGKASSSCCAFWFSGVILAGGGLKPGVARSCPGEARPITGGN